MLIVHTKVFRPFNDQSRCLETSEAIQPEVLHATNRGFVADMHASILIIRYYVEMMMNVKMQGGTMEPEVLYLSQATSFQVW